MSQKESRADVAAKSRVARDLRAAINGAVLAHRARGRIAGRIKRMLETGSDTAPAYAYPRSRICHSLYKLHIGATERRV